MQNTVKYERPSIATLSADDIWALIGPVQGYIAVGRSPGSPLDAVDASGVSELSR